MSTAHAKTQSPGSSTAHPETTLPRASQQDGTYPRPQLVRDNWTDLCGTWNFRFDDHDRGERDHWEKLDHWNGDQVREIQVPFPFESPASGIGDTGFHRVVWYQRSIDVPAPNGNVVLHFGAVDYRCQVWVNGIFVGRHEGGGAPFDFDITLALSGADRASIVVRAEDDPDDFAQTRGKQDWRLQPHAIWYHRTTGIWQPVWLEVVSPVRIGSLHWTTELPQSTVTAQLRFNRRLPASARLQLTVRLGERVLAHEESDVAGATEADLVTEINRQRNGQAYEEILWRPDTPTLLDAELALVIDGQVVDRVASYFGLRSASVGKGWFRLNDRPCYLRSVLNQGYSPISHLAAPSAAALREEVETIKNLGFNATRLHQKYEDPRFLFWADKLGLMVWSEAPAAYSFSPLTVARTVAEWVAILERDRSHPSIVAWVPINESWGVQHLPHDSRHQAYTKMLVELSKSIDPTRPVISNDGWEHTDSDLITIHDYEGDPQVLAERYANREVILNMDSAGDGRRLIVGDWQQTDGLPIMLTEFGGVSYTEDAPEGSWGYTTAAGADDYRDRLQGLFGAVHAAGGLVGFCYTQLVDTGQETNGLLFEDRRPKLPVETIAQFVRGGQR